ncbi:MAG TPA: CRTAC1 family protein [Vicinamibacterales bacterium]|nr:CRTAC1 family protein [Vicinamibacterales bacterium]
MRGALAPAQIGMAALLTVSCTRAPVPNTADRPWFEDIAGRAGIRFVHQSGHRDRFFIPEIVGSGAALFDMDNDGYLDLFLVQSGALQAAAGEKTGHRLYRNRGDGTFEDVTAGSGVDVPGYGMGVAAGDFDNDGNVDLYVTNYGANVLLKGDGHGHFKDVTATAGVASSGWSTSAAFLDYDGDGALDLFVVHYLNWTQSAEVACVSETGLPDYCSPKAFDLPRSASLFHNNGNGTFTDVSEQAGLNRAVGNGLGVVAGDFDGDGRIDVFVANDSTPNQLWLNRGGGRFEESALAMGCAVDDYGTRKAGMGVHAADVDGDGALDLFVVNFENESDSFFRNEKTFFRDDTAAVGLRTISRPFTRFGTAMHDFDNDGLLDIYEANGRVRLRVDPGSGDPYAEPNLLFRGLAGPRFEEVMPRGGTRPLLVGTSRGAAFGDFDNDGGIDIVVVNRDAAPYVLHNIVADRGHWAMFRVLDEHGRDALGAELTMTVGARAVRVDVRAAYSYLSSNDPRVHVGLGKETIVRALSVRWPDGRREDFGDQPADKIVTLRRGAGLAPSKVPGF